MAALGAREVACVLRSVINKMDTDCFCAELVLVSANKIDAGNINEQNNFIADDSLKNAVCKGS